MRQWIGLCIVPILVSVAVAHSGEKTDNSSNKKNICDIAQNFIEKHKVLFPSRKDICQCGEFSSVEVVGKSGESITKYQRCNKCSDNRPAGVVSEFCKKNGNGSSTRISVCCVGSVAAPPAQAPTAPPTETATTTTTAPTTSCTFAVFGSNVC